MADKHEIVQRWFALWNGEIGALEEIVADGIVVHAARIGEISDDPMLGRVALGDWIATTRSMAPNLRLRIEVGPLVDGDLIAVRWRARDAVRIDFTGTDILRMEAGRIVEYWVNADVLVMMQQAGILPPS